MFMITEEDCHAVGVDSPVIRVRNELPA